MYLDAALRAVLERDAADVVAWLRDLQVRFSGTAQAVELITHRVKSERSIAQKLEAFPHLVVNTMQDIIGCRAVCVNGVGVRAVNREIVAHFGARVPRAPRARRTELGYLSWHAVLEPVPGGPGYRTEIQVRTLTQHAWARTSELLAYKKGDRAEALMAELRMLSRDLDEQDRRIEDLFRQAWPEGHQ